MKKTSALQYAVILAMLLALCAPSPAALAVGSTEVWVKNVKLDAGTPYW